MYLPPFDVVPAQSGTLESNLKHQAERYLNRKSLDWTENPYPHQTRGIEFSALVSRAQVKMTPLTLCERVIWEATTPHVMAVPRYIAFSEGGERGGLNLFPSAVADRYEQAFRSIAFHAISVRSEWSNYFAILLGMRSNEAYLLASWCPISNQSVAPFDEVKRWARRDHEKRKQPVMLEFRHERSRAFDVAAACDEHDALVTNAADA